MYTDENGETHYYDNETDNYKQNHYHFLYSRNLSRGFTLNTTLHYTHGEGYFEQYKEDEEFADYALNNPVIQGNEIFTTDLIRRKWLRNDFYGTLLSLNYRGTRLESSFGAGFNNYNGDHFGRIIWARTAGESEINRQWYRGTGDKSDLSAFAKSNFELNSSTQLYADVQIRAVNYLFFNPKTGLNFTPSLNQRIYISVAVANREPNRDNFTDAEPGTTPKHEVLYDYEAGYNFKNEWLEATTTLYYMDYHNQLILTGEINDVGAPVMTNVKDSYRTGIELTAGLRISHLLRWNMSMALSRNKIKRFTWQVDNWDYWNDPDNQPYQVTGELENADIAFSPAFIASGMLTINPDGKLQLNLVPKYTGKQFLDNTQSAERQLNSYFLTDMLLNYSINPRFAEEIRFSFQLINIFNKKYESNAWIYRYWEEGTEKKLDGYFPQAGTHFLAGLWVRF
jgi:iron complex outermembrane receptor protein